MNDKPENPVHVEPDALADEAAAIELPPDATPAPGGAAPGSAAAADAIGQAPPGSWASSTPTVVYLVDKFIVPNWELTDVERRDLADALTPVLDDLFPGGLGSERWAPYFRLAGVAATITLARMKNGELKPLRNPSDATSSAPSDPDVAAGPFMTGGPAGAGSH